MCDVAAGNSGPGAATVGSPGTSPLAITVGASRYQREIPVMTIKNGQLPIKLVYLVKASHKQMMRYKGQTLPIVDVGLGSAADYKEKM